MKSNKYLTIGLLTGFIVGGCIGVLAWAFLQNLFAISICAFCKVVIRHAAIDKILKLRRRWEREVSLDYLMSEKFVQLAEPE